MIVRFCLPTTAESAQPTFYTGLSFARSKGGSGNETSRFRAISWASGLKFQTTNQISRSTRVTCKRENAHSSVLSHVIQISASLYSTRAHDPMAWQRR